MPQRVEMSGTGTEAPHWAVMRRPGMWTGGGKLLETGDNKYVTTQITHWGDIAGYCDLAHVY